MNLELQLRELAKSAYWQSLYHYSKENSGIQLFENISNLSGLQIRFLNWLQIYDGLYEDLAQHKDFISQSVIRNNFRCDCYLTYRKKLNEFEWKKYRQEERKRKIKERHPKRHKKGNMIPVEVDLRRE